MNKINNKMNDSTLYALSVIGGVYIALCGLFLILPDKNFKYPLKILWGLILAVPMAVTGISYELGPNTRPENKLITNLKYIKTLEPRYVYEHDKYMFFHDNVGPINISEIQGYTTDSAAIADGILVYEKQYPVIWGFVKQNAPEGESDYVYTFEVTDAIQKASQEPAELKHQE